MADPDPVALAGASAGRDVAAHREVEALLGDPGLDVVAVCTPPADHARLTAAALEAGKHLLVEKPLALTAEDAARVIEAAARAPGLATVGLVYRWHRLHRIARSLIAAGRIGPVAALHAVMTSDAAISPERSAGWRTDPAAGGGVLQELGTHQVDLWRFLLGSELGPLRAVTSGQSATLAGRMGDGTVVSATLSSAAGCNHELTAYGRSATLSVRSDRYDGLEIVPVGQLPGDPRRRLSRGARRVRALPGALRSHRRGGDLALAFQAQWRAFAAAIRDDAPLVVSLEDGRRALDAVLAAQATSAASHAVAGEPVA